MNGISYEFTGPDGAPLVALFVRSMWNSKLTRPGSKAYAVSTFVCRADIEPHEALKTGEDQSVCGTCRYRPLLSKARSLGAIQKSPVCYVRVHESVLSSWRAWKRNPSNYPVLDLHSDAQRAFLSQAALFRFGGYGESVLLGPKVVRQIVDHLRGDIARDELPVMHTAYTHMWKDPNYEWSKDYFMASVDTENEQIEAHSAGWRTFRVRQPDEKVLDIKTTSPSMRGVELRNKEIVCPASKEAGHKSTCADCALCSGSLGARARFANVVIIAHDMVSRSQYKKFKFEV